MVAERISTHVEYVSDIFSRHAAKFEELFGPLKALLLVLAIRLFPVVSLLTGLAFAVDELLTYLEGGDTIIGDFIDALAKFLGAEPAKVAEVLGDIASAAGWLLAASLGVSLFAGAIRSLAGALVLLKGLQWAVGLLAGLGAAGSGTSAGAAGVAAGAAGMWAGVRALVARVSPLASMLLLSGDTPGNGYLELSDREREKAREDARRRYRDLQGRTKDDDIFAGMSRAERDAAKAKSSGERLLHPSLMNDNLPSSGKSGRLGAPSSERFGGESRTAAGMEQLRTMLQNMNGNLAKMSTEAAVNATITDARQDNRQFPVSTTVNVGGVHVQQPAAAPAAVGAAVGNAAASAASAAGGQVSRIASEPAATP
jgi:hypothetical protein